MSNHYHFIDTIVLKKLNIYSKCIVKSTLLENINININDDYKNTLFNNIGLITYYRRNKKCNCICKKKF